MKKTCFVVCPIGEEGSEIRKRAESLFNHVIEPACDKFNLAPIRVDKIAITGLITNKIIRSLRDADVVVADLTGHNPNVFYELGVRHALNKPVILIKSEKDKRPFDIQSVNIIDYSSLDDPTEMQNLKNKLIKHIESIFDESEEIDLPFSSILGECPKIESIFLSKIEEVFGQVKGLREYLYNNFSSDIDEKTKIDAQYIDGEDRAFAALTEATERAKKEVRSSRFFPDSVLGNQGYVKAIESRVLGTDGKKPLSQYYRIVALNNPAKIRDVIHHLNHFMGRAFELHLSKTSNAFELVIIDDTDAFIHFYKEKMVIASTLHIKERNIVLEFKEIYDKMLKSTEPELIFNCADINMENLGAKIQEVRKIFDILFGEKKSSGEK